MTYIHLFQTERCQTYVLIKAGQTQSEIAQILGRHKSTGSRDISHDYGRRGSRTRQSQNLYHDRSQGSFNVRDVNEK